MAAQTDLESVKQIYSDGNVRVRSTQARVDEGLRRQLEKNLGNKSGDQGTTKAQDTDSLYPSIGELPALGVKYADLYRTTKIQEAIFQTLTQEYELAKVQEAKETPSVKVLDPPDVPGRRVLPSATTDHDAGNHDGDSDEYGVDAWEAALERCQAGDPQRMFGARSDPHSSRPHALGGHEWFDDYGQQQSLESISPKPRSDAKRYVVRFVCSNCFEILSTNFALWATGQSYS